MLECRIPQGQLLKKIFESIKEMVNDINLECGESGLGVQAMDASQVSLISVCLLNGAFDHYECKGQYCLGLNMTQVTKVMKLCGPDDHVIIRHNPNTESDRVTFIFESPGERKVSSFDLRLMSLHTDSLGIPKMQHEAVIEMSTKSFIKTITDLSQFSETLVIDVNQKGIKFSAEGDFGEGSTFFQASPPEDTSLVENVSLTCTADVSCIFSSRYMLYFAKGCMLAERIQLSLSNKQLLKLQLDINNDKYVGSITYFLAPRFVENE
uniref:DNA sliding clamp PCNA n=1 Tax=Dermatophagoides pteronyssinus TaxID=6956 RepID=A0A6P6XLT0_DERPT|nr:proliferating cell nuclear antigen-like [Dermatophagoides pteronyssinus]